MELLLWSYYCGVGAEARAPTRPTRPRSSKMLTFFCFLFLCFFCLKRQANSGASPLVALQQGAFGASPELQSLLRWNKSNLRATSEAPEKLGACWPNNRLRSSLELRALELSWSSRALSELFRSSLGALWSSLEALSELWSSLGARSSGAWSLELAGRATSSGALRSARSLLAEQQAPKLSGVWSLLAEQQALELSRSSLGALELSRSSGALLELAGRAASFGALQSSKLAARPASSGAFRSSELVGRATSSGVCCSKLRSSLELETC